MGWLTVPVGGVRGVLFGMDTNELMTVFQLLLEKSRLQGTVEGYETLKTGNINDTYRVGVQLPSGETGFYMMQRINHSVFQQPEQVAHNAAMVTAHIRQKLWDRGESDLDRRVLQYYPMEDGNYFYPTPDGSDWRVFSYVPHSVCISNPEDPKILYGTGVAFGRFQRDLADFPVADLYTTIPDFHHTPGRFLDLAASAIADPCGRAAEMREELAYLFSMRKYSFLFDQLQTNGSLPSRVVHNDTKCNNVMFDRDTMQPLAVIDLDTVMAGLVAHDFGDAVRFACNDAAEDAEDLHAVSLNLDRYRCFTSGFIGELRDVLTEQELQTLPEGVLVITLELAARFLKDDLDGDVYFKCSKNRHNRIRARCQIALAKDIFSKLPDMHRILSELARS